MFYPNIRILDQSEPYNQLEKKDKKSKFRQPLIILGILSLAILLSGLVYYFGIHSNTQLQASAHSAIAKKSLQAFPITVPTMKYGFAIDTFQVLERKVKNGEFLADILNRNHIEYPVVEQIVKNADGIFDFRQFRAGSTYAILTKDSTQAGEYFIYEPSVYEYFVFELKNDLEVRKEERPITTEVKAAAGTVETSLWNTMVENGMSFELTAKMEDALQWSIDFHHVQKGDQFKLVYDQNYIEGKQVGVGAVYAAYYKTANNEYYAVYYPEEGKYEGYYDLEGRPMKSSFLKSPVKYSRISSRFNLNRFHPILKRRKPHLGTDYAAPYGTPIYAVGNGVVTKASYTKGNGRFVKIKHDDTYQTQYLHMQGFAKGIHPGVQVKQGQVIGYVGSTGLATGPHVCFRFWKNGRQINHLNLNFPPPEPLPAEIMASFEPYRDSLLSKLNTVSFKPLQTESEELTSTEETEKEEKIKKGNP